MRIRPIWRGYRQAYLPWTLLGESVGFYGERNEKCEVFEVYQISPMGPNHVMSGYGQNVFHSPPKMDLFDVQNTTHG